MKRVDLALEAFSKGSACSQAVAVVFAEEMGLDAGSVHRLATGFGGGIGSKQYACGAVTGVVMVLSAVHGSTDPEESDRKAHTKARTASFVDAFITRVGAADCRSIVGFDMADDDALAEARERDVFGTVCVDCVRIAVEEVESRI